MKKTEDAIKRPVESFVIEKYCLDCIYFTDENGKHIKGCFLLPYKLTQSTNLICKDFLNYDK